MTQLVELRDGFEQLEAAGVELYAISYDDCEALRDFVETYGIRYRMLSDVDSAVIRSFGILNTVDEVPKLTRIDARASSSEIPIASSTRLA